MMIMTDTILKDLTLAMAQATGAARRTLETPVMAELVERAYQRGGAEAVLALIDDQLATMQNAYIDLAIPPQ